MNPSLPPAPRHRLRIRPLTPDDSMEDLTRLIHRAYKPLADAGMKFVGSHQTVEITRERCTGPGVDCWVAELDGRVIGTITLRGPTQTPDCPLYGREGVAIAGQMAVDPDHQGLGIAKQLWETLLARARERGVRELMGDTSEHATRLIETYRRWGFEVVGRIKWPQVNYHSVVMSMRL